MKLILVATVAIALCLTGCDKLPLPKPKAKPKATAPKKPKKKPKKKPAPEAEWSNMGGGNFNIKENKKAGIKYGARVHVSIYQGELKFNPVKLPNGTVLEAEGKKLTTARDNFDDLVIDVEKRLMEEPWVTFQGRYPKVDWKVPFTVTIPGHKPIKEVTQPIQVGFVVGAYYKPMSAKKGSTFLWPGEKGPPPGEIPAAIAWTFGDFKALGTADKVRDVRWVAVVDTELNGKTRRCGGYIGVSHVTVNAYDATVRIVDRFTGETLKEKKFKGKTSCPRSVFAKAGEKVVRQTGPSRSKMQKWATGQMRRLPKTI